MCTCSVLFDGDSVHAVSWNDFDYLTQRQVNRRVTQGNLECYGSSIHGCAILNMAFVVDAICPAGPSWPKITLHNNVWSRTRKMPRALSNCSLIFVYFPRSPVT
jgi:hypothetical protein